jgi:hypothetical protein
VQVGAVAVFFASALPMEPLMGVLNRTQETTFEKQA